MSRGVHPLASVIAAVACGISGVHARWAGCRPEAKQRIYFANHTSHLDFVMLWSVLPGDLRAHTRPVAAKDYWEHGARGYLARKVFRAVLIRRATGTQAESREDAIAVAKAGIDELIEAMGETESLIFFPEGTRGTGDAIAPFRSGLYYLSERKPQVELVPVYIENLYRILPKGEFVPVPLVCVLTFGTPMHMDEGEEKQCFLERARAAIEGLGRKGQS
jgi:1-acyl-sn-glycerol-3-phosphate acyltransferase